MRCNGETSVRDLDLGYFTVQCSLQRYHHGAHENRKRHIYWTSDDIIWDFELNDYRAIA